MSKLCKVGLALGGGGARGLAHMGVFGVLEREGIPIDLVTGTSMGALVAAVYALSPRYDAAQERFRRYINSLEFKKTNLEFLHDSHREVTPRLEGIFHHFSSFIKKGFFYSQSLTKRAPISEENFAQNVNFLLEDVEIQQTQIPLAIIALDLNSAEEVILKEGSLRRAVSASCAIPGILPPVKIGDRELVDGGWIDRVPVHPAREMGADLVVAVDVTEIFDNTNDFNTGLGIAFRANEASRFALGKLQLKEADVVICPDVGGVHWSDFSRMEECINAGESAAQKKIKEIKNLYKKKKIKKIFHIPLGLASY